MSRLARLPCPGSRRRISSSSAYRRETGVLRSPARPSFDSRPRGSRTRPNALKRSRSNRQRDLADKSGENEQSAQAAAVAFLRQEKPAKADDRGKRDGDLASGVHVLFPQQFPPLSLAIHRCYGSLPEAVVIGGITIGEKQEQSKNKIASWAIFFRARRSEPEGVRRTAGGTGRLGGGLGGGLRKAPRRGAPRGAKARCRVVAVAR